MPVEPRLCINVLELSDPRDGFARNGQLDRCIIHKDGLGLKHLIAGDI